MIKKFKIIIFICIIALFSNFIAKIYFVDRQNNKITVLQKVLISTRSRDSHKMDEALLQKLDYKDDIKKIFKQIPEEFFFTEYAVKIRSLFDRNQLLVEDSLVFTPGKSKHPDMLKYNTKITVKGSYRNIKKLMADLQSLPGLVYIESPSMVKTMENPHTIQLDLELFVLFRRNAA